MPGCSRKGPLHLRDGMSAQVDFFGVQKELRLDIVDVPVVVGDYVLNHVGFAIRRIPPEEVGETLALFDQILKDRRGGRPHGRGRPRGDGRGGPGPGGAEAAVASLFDELKFRDPERARALSEALAREVEAAGRAISLMHVCGSHEQAIARFGLRAALPPRARRHHGARLPGVRDRHPRGGRGGGARRAGGPRLHLR